MIWLVKLLCMGVFTACTTDLPVQIYAAASIAPVAEQILSSPKQQRPFAINVASSSILAKQIEAGAPADLYLSASAVWTAHLEQTGHILPEQKWEGLSNSLVLITNKKTASPCHLDRTSQIAIADWNHVPAGMYAREALTQAGIFERLTPSLLSVLDVHAVLTYVARGDVPCGIVYKSDTLLSDEIQIVPSILDHHPIDIRYSFAMLQRSQHPHAGILFHSLKTEVSTYKSFGFSFLSEAP